MPKAGEYKWLSSLRVLVYNASVYPKSDIYLFQAVAILTEFYQSVQVNVLNLILLFCILLRFSAKFALDTNLATGQGGSQAREYLPGYRLVENIYNTCRVVIILLILKLRFSNQISI